MTPPYNFCSVVAILLYCIGSARTGGAFASEPFPRSTGLNRSSLEQMLWGVEIFMSGRGLPVETKKLSGGVIVSDVRAGAGAGEASDFAVSIAPRMPAEELQSECKTELD